MPNPEYNGHYSGDPVDCLVAGKLHVYFRLESTFLVYSTMDGPKIMFRLKIFGLHDGVKVTCVW